MNIRAKSAAHIEDSLTICRCQVDGLDCSNISNIDHVSKDLISLWQKIICCSSQPIEVDIDIDIDYNHHKSNSSSHPNSLMEILKLIISIIEMLEKHLILDQRKIQPP